MAHVLIGCGDPHMARMLAEVLSFEGHAVSVPRDAWEALAVLRSSLHPLVIVLVRDGWVTQLTAEQIAAFVAASDELGRHALVELAYWPEWPMPQLQAVHDALRPIVFPGMQTPDTILAAVAAAAARVGA